MTRRTDDETHARTRPPPARHDAPLARHVLLEAFVLASCLTGTAACHVGSSADAPPPCDQTCSDAIAVQALREAMKLAYNLTLQGKPVGAQNASTPCPEGGSVRITGTATSDATQGTTEVTLTYSFDDCHYTSAASSTANENFDLSVRGNVTEKGMLAVQSSATTALLIASDALTIEGVVYDPPTSYSQKSCKVVLAQNGNVVSGTLCGRVAGFSF